MYPAYLATCYDTGFRQSGLGDGLNGFGRRRSGGGIDLTVLALPGGFVRFGWTDTHTPPRSGYLPALS